MALSRLSHAVEKREMDGWVLVFSTRKNFLKETEITSRYSVLLCCGNLALKAWLCCHGFLLDLAGPINSRLVAPPQNQDEKVLRPMDEKNCDSVI